MNDSGSVDVRLADYLSTSGCGMSVENADR